MKKVLLLLSLLALVLGACGGSGDTPPAMSADEVEQTALAEARTMVANTQAALPTATLAPIDTPTLAPTDTPIPLPTIAMPTIEQPTANAFTPQPTPTTAVGNGGCYPMKEWEVESANINMYNQTKGIVTLSINVTLANGDCGAFSRQFEKTNTVVVPLGCAWVWAWVDGKQDFTLSTSFCMDTPRNYSITVTNDALKVK